jgi:alkanesulfonate monooxygenase SsuD/methylene tetrahydromethanopterin reductase-like flavin-dependent oxidoreductase (luciferase family)
MGLGIVDIETGTTVPLAEQAAQAQRAEELGFASVWLNDHFWHDAPDGRRMGGHDALITLAYIAAKTERIRFGNLVVCNSFRHPAQLARESAALADCSDGRFILGLGAGWNVPEYKAMGLDHTYLVSRLEEAVDVLHKLFAGGRLNHAGRYYNLEESMIQQTHEPPDIWIGGNGPRVLKLAGEAAAGWNWGVPWSELTAPQFEPLADQFRAAAQAAGRNPDDLTISVNIMVLLADDSKRDALVERSKQSLGGSLLPVVMPVGPEELVAIVDRLRGLGVDHLVINFAPFPFGVLGDLSAAEIASAALGLA